MTIAPFIRPAESEDIDAICALLHSKMNRKIEPERWRNLMTYQWLQTKPDLGRVIEDQGEILGFLGMVYADRDIDRQHHRIVNICAWYLDKSLRGLGLGKGIMADATSGPDQSYTIMTSSKNTLGILYDVGYEVLDNNRYLWYKKNHTATDLSLITDFEEIYQQSPRELRTLLEDHISLPVTPVLINYQDQQCLIVFSVKKKGQDVTYFDVLFTDDRTFLGQHGQSLANLLLPEQPAVLAADCRFVGGQAIGAGLEKLPVPRFYKTNTIEPENIDHLYTELQLLDLKLD